MLNNSKDWILVNMATSHTADLFLSQQVLMPSYLAIRPKKERLVGDGGLLFLISLFFPGGRRGCDKQLLSFLLLLLKNLVEYQFEVGFGLKPV